MISKTVLLERGEIATITISNPERLNALDLEILMALEKVVDNLDSESRAVFIKSVGEKAFVAGADVAAMHNMSPNQIKEFVELGQRVMNKIENFDAPVVAVVDGFALGGGLELALACDIILASEKAKVGLPEVTLGLIPGFGGTQRILKRLSFGQAKRLVFTGSYLDAFEAKELGLIDILVAPSYLPQAINDLKNQFLKVSPLAVKKAKILMNAYCKNEFELGLKNEAKVFLEIFDSNDRKEGTSAFIEKRAAKFSGN